MPGVKITADADVKAKLGFGFNAKLSFLWGVSYPLPDWYHRLDRFQRGVWYSYRRFGDFMAILLFVSNFVMICKAYDDIRVFTTCLGTMTYVVCVLTKIGIFRRKETILENVLDRIHKISENLDKNPVQDKQFFELHHSYYHHVKFFGVGKNFAIASGVCTLALFELVRGLFETDPGHRHLPMSGWFPYNTFVNPQFSFSCIFQLVAYLAFLLKDVAIDVLFLTIIVTLNTHLKYLGRLMGLIMEEDNRNVEKIEGLKWWIQQHQLVLWAIEDFKKISNPYLFAKYISVSLILFLGGVLVTSNAEWDLVQQSIVLAINFSNLLQLYIFSVTGDAILENGLKIAQDGLNADLFFENKQLRINYLHVVTRTSKPILIQFGDINPLSAHSFGQIVKMTFSYFLTIVQVRAEANGHQAQSPK